MLRFIDAEGTSRYSTGSPGRENAPAVAEPPTKPISPGKAAAVTAPTANRRNHLARVPRYLSMNFLTAPNPPFYAVLAAHKQCRRLWLRNETRPAAAAGCPTPAFDIAVG